MRQRVKTWLFSWSTFVCSVIAALISFCLGTEWSSEIRERAIAPLEFSLREKLSRGPAFSDKLKVLVYGDKAKREFGVQELITTRQWADLIAQISSREPRAILFDKMFTFSLGSPDDIEYFKKTMAELRVPVIAAGVFNNSAPTQGEYDSKVLVDWKMDRPESLQAGRLSRFTGPDVQLRDSFDRLGGIQLSHSAAVQPAWFDLDSQKILPHLGLSFFNDASIQGNQVHLGTEVIYLDRFGRIPVNFIEQSRAYKYFLPMASIMRLGVKSPVLPMINKGDVVLVLPSMYTGSTDFKNSPVGRIAGGLYHASLINSVLIDSPIIPVFNDFLSSFLVLFLLSMCFRLIARLPRFSTAAGLVSLITVAIVAVGILSFVLVTFQLDWHVYAFFTASYGAALLSFRAVQDEKHAERVELLLEGMVAKDVLKQIRHRPEILKLRPREQKMTVMFIDIEGFSLRTKSLMPVDMFSVLHAQIDQISRIVHEHGGIVDRVLGDGMLCFFGFSFDNQTNEVQFDHAERALKCALAVQYAAALLTSQEQSPGTNLGAVLPLRIGLCTGDAFVGNMGTHRRLDFTVIGHTVNMAKRYEDACETFRVFMSESTYESLQSNESVHKFDNVQFFPRYMSLKHHYDLVLGWECDPFSGFQSTYKAALKKAQAESMDLDGTERSTAKHSIEIRLNQSSQGYLKEFGEDRLTVITDTYFCRKVNLVVELVSESEDLNVQLAVSNLKTLYCQVAAGSALGQNKYYHELVLLHTSAEKKQVLMRLLSQEFQT